MDEYLEEELQDAKDMLSDAEKLRNAGGTDELSSTGCIMPVSMQHKQCSIRKDIIRQLTKG
jgi:hypothetical protein